MSFCGHLGCHFGVILGSFSALGPRSWLWSFWEPFMSLLGLPFGCHFGLILGPFSGLKIGAVFVPFRGPILGSFLGSFWCYFPTRKEDMFFTCFSYPFESLLNPGMAIKHVKTQGFCMVLRCPRRSDKTPENVQNGSNKRPKYDPKLVSKLAFKQTPKITPKRPQNGAQK